MDDEVHGRKVSDISHHPRGWYLLINIACGQNPMLLPLDFELGTAEELDTERPGMSQAERDFAAEVMVSVHSTVARCLSH